jgi:UMF1 family MFS transporter
MSEPVKRTTSAAPVVNNRSEIFGWMMYDWANSAFATTVAGALLNPYLTKLAQNAVGDNGVVLSLGPLGAITSKSFFGFAIGISVFLQVCILPVLGAIGDYSHHKKSLMAVLCYLGVTATCLLYFIIGDRYLIGAVLFIAANVSFGGTIVLYNSYLPEICTDDQMDKVSSHGFAIGYIGGGALLAMNLTLLQNARSLGITSGFAVRISLLSAGIWWGAFALITFARLSNRAPKRSVSAGSSYLTAGFKELSATWHELLRLPHTLKFLIAFLIYNDGVQAVISMSAVFLSQELFTPAQRVAGDDVAFVLKMFLMVQFVAFIGSLFFERIALWIGTKQAIVSSLLIWCGIVIYAWRFLRTTGQAWVMAAVIAIVLGGSQALSRSLFSKMTPAGYESSFFGLYEFSERGTSWLGPVVFSLVVGINGNFRMAILSLIVLFVIGTFILVFTDTDRAIREAAAGRRE